MNTRLDLFDNSSYHPGARLRRGIWYCFNVLFFSSWLPLPYIIKRNLLRCFGAQIGRGVIIKPRVNIKYPWKLSIGDYSWIGENVWIDNLAKVSIGEHCCISQGAMLLCGNHDFKSHKFDLIVEDITVENGVWIGARSTVCPGVKCGTHSVLSVNSVASNNMEDWGIYRGNPAQKINTRTIK